MLDPPARRNSPLRQRQPVCVIHDQQTTRPELRHDRLDAGLPIVAIHEGEVERSVLELVCDSHIAGQLIIVRHCWFVIAMVERNMAELDCRNRSNLATYALVPSKVVLDA